MSIDCLRMCGTWKAVVHDTIALQFSFSRDGECRE